MLLIKRAIPFLFLSFLTFAGAHGGEHDDVLDIYTYDSFTAEWGPGQKVKEGFEEECNCEVKFHTTDGASTLLTKLKLEGKQTKADLVIGLDNFMLADAEATDFFVETSIEPSMLSAVNNWQSTVFVPYDQGYIAMVYHKDRVANPPKSLDELVDDAHKDIRYILLDPRSSTPGLAFTAWVEQTYKDESKAYWQKLAAQTVTVTPGWSEGYGLFLEGEADAVVSYVTSPSYHRIVENRDDIAAFIFDRHIRQIEVAAVVKYSKNQYLANTFLHYLLRPETQAIIASGNWMFPVVKNVPLPDKYARVPQGAIDYDPTVKRQTLIDHWQQYFKK